MIDYKPTRSTDNLPEFGSQRYCPKCWHMKLSRQYKQKTRLENGPEYKEYEIPRIWPLSLFLPPKKEIKPGLILIAEDWITVTCNSCGYSWNEKPADGGM